MCKNRHKSIKRHTRVKIATKALDTTKKQKLPIIFYSVYLNVNKYCWIINLLKKKKIRLLTIIISLNGLWPKMNFARLVLIK